MAQLPHPQVFAALAVCGFFLPDHDRFLLTREGVPDCVVLGTDHPGSGSSAWVLLLFSVVYLKSNYLCI